MKSIDHMNKDVTEQEFIKVVRETNEQTNAHDIFHKIHSLEQEREIHESRWFWELLQNSKDSVDKGETVEVYLKHSEEKITFAHTGNDFEIEEIVHLIEHGSTKGEDDSKTGRFGTGFISTHLLTKSVQIIGQLTNGQLFDFVLDRNAKDVEGLKLLQRSSRANFFSSLHRREKSNVEYQTQFIYTLDEKGVAAAKTGLESIEKLIPFALTFNEKLKKVIIESNNEQITFEKTGTKSGKSSNFPQISEIVIKHKQKNSEAEIKILVAQEGATQSAILLRADGSTYEVVNQIDYPKLFFFFPLIGTEDFGVPVIVNSEEFEPKSERNGLYLSAQKDNTVIAGNKKLVEQGVRLIKPLILYCIENGYRGLHQLMLFRFTANFKEVDGIWLQDMLKEVVTSLQAVTLIQPEDSNENLVELASARIPVADDLDQRQLLWELSNELSPKNTPAKVTSEEWFSILENLSEIFEVDASELFGAVSIRSLCDEIHDLESLGNLDDQLLTTASDVWLNKLYNCLTEDEHGLLRTKNVIPNQNGDFVNVEAEGLFEDEGIGDDLKDLSAKYGEDLRAVLVDQRINLPDKVCSERSTSKVIIDLNNYASNAEDRLGDKDQRSALIGHLYWLQKNDELKSNLPFPVIVGGLDKGDNEIYQIEYLTATSSPFLAPVVSWSHSYSFFAGLIRPQDCLIEEYAGILQAEDLLRLEQWGFIYPSPLIRVREKATSTSIRQLLRNPDDEPLLRDDKEGFLHKELECWDFYNFRSTGDYIFARNSTPSSTKRILEFILNDAVNNDENFTGFNSVKGRDDQEIEIRNSIWVGRLRKIKWVNEISEDVSKDYEPVPPNALNISTIIGDDDELREIIKGEKQRELFGLLGISVADLIRNSLPTEEEKVEWDNTFVALINSGLKPKLAQEMLGDDKLVEEYAKIQSRRKSIRRNQKIGKMLEEAIEEIFKEPEMKSKGFTIIREPIGSDYMLGVDNEVETDLINEVTGEQELLRIGNFYIELKATGRDYAAMTQVQAQKAVDNKSNYALVVLPLDGSSITKKKVKTSARFVTNIGSVLDGKLQEFKSYKKNKAKATKKNEKVQLSIEDGQTRYRVQPAVWQEGGVGLYEYVKYLLR